MDRLRYRDDRSRDEREYRDSMLESDKRYYE